MEEKEKIDYLKSMLTEMEKAYYGGFKVNTNEKDIEIVKWAIEKLEEINKYSLMELLDKAIEDSRHIEINL